MSYYVSVSYVKSCGSINCDASAVVEAAANFTYAARVEAAAIATSIAAAVSAACVLTCIARTASGIAATSIAAAGVTAAAGIAAAAGVTAAAIVAACAYVTVTDSAADTELLGKAGSSSQRRHYRGSVFLAVKKDFSQINEIAPLICTCAIIL